MQTDPLSDFLTTLRNASRTSKKECVIPYSRLKSDVAHVLKKEGYIAEISKKIKKDHPVLEVDLVYVDKNPKISHVERVSKQSRRVYLGVKEIHRVRNGTGLLVLSTPKGILSGKDARKEQVGGEALFKLW